MRLNDVQIGYAARSRQRGGSAASRGQLAQGYLDMLAEVELKDNEQAAIKQAADELASTDGVSNATFRVLERLFSRYVVKKGSTECQS